MNKKHKHNFEKRKNTKNCKPECFEFEPERERKREQEREFDTCANIDEAYMFLAVAAAAASFYSFFNT